MRCVSRLFSHSSMASQHSREDSLLAPPRTDEDQLSGSPLISQLYNEAAEFEKVLVHSGCIDSRSEVVDGANGFDDLVARDLTDSERAIADHAAKMSATQTSWITEHDLDHNVLYDELDEKQSVGTPTISDTATAFSRKYPSLKRSTSQESETSLGPQEIVDILVEEFGSLTAPGEEEKLILETDGCLIHDVAIVGVIHLTTHRLAFHASLLATRPDLSRSQEVIKSGPAVLHRKGWRAKRRVWMELTHDMMCTYGSSSDEGRIRPLCTVLLSSIVEIPPIDPKHPRDLKTTLTPPEDNVGDYCEFDTEESAQEWRRELTGALFMYRHRRRETYAGSTPESAAGVRLSCPLVRVADFQDETDILPGFPNILIIGVRLSSLDTCVEDGANVSERQVFQIGPVRPAPKWSHFGQFVADAKKRLQSAPSATLEYPMFVDFGPLSFFETLPADPAKSAQTELESAKRKEMSIRSALGFGPDSKLWVARARIYRTVTTSGYFVLSAHHIGFWSKNLTQRDIRYRLPLSRIKSAEAYHLNWLNVDALVLGIEGQPDMRFVFKELAQRDEAIERINERLDIIRGTSHLSSGSNTPSSGSGRSSPPLEFDDLSISSPTSTTGRTATDILAPLSRSLAAATAAAAELPPVIQRKIPKVINLPTELLIPRAQLHFVCLTIGSRGDVQPYIALGLGLKKEGHRVTIVTHQEYHDWIVGFGIEHRQAGGDPGALMKLSVENKMFSPDFFKESLSNFRPWLDQLLTDAWVACKDADVLLESPSAMAGVHIAEALNIPYFRTFTMPWTKTTEFPHGLLSPPVESPTFNSASNVMWAATSGQINKWRRQSLGIGNTDMGHLAQSKITFIYNFSQAVVPKPLDWPDSTIISGYWFLDNPDLNWTPPQTLLDWMAKARKDGKPIVYIGFGSITVPHPNRVTARIVEAVLQSDVRAIISKGWSARMSKGNDKDPEVEMPPECYQLDKVPHDWLFPQIDAAMHHGGAGTTGASLRAGIPTLIKPWFGDQFFWASRVQRLGAGLKVPSLRVSDVAEALTKATSNATMRERAAMVGEKIRAEDGVHTAIYAINTYLHRAAQDRASLVK
ncbi:glycosyltransferase family 1 protein [Crucibulum laeve]|uniref:sterol 3beta-glucosyltransferase n=1 Tax=Crucibulum laeve TaxID=68775 RepID=A0A5C3MHE2_9AGAR|nr:glycosyltransferase family 1 protein [Crucibulum laeve]